MEMREEKIREEKGRDEELGIVDSSPDHLSVESEKR